MTILGLTIPMAVFWLAVALLMAIVEGLTLGLTTIWFAGGAVASVIAALLGASLPLQVGLFFAVSIVLLLLTRPWMKRHFKKNLTQTNVNALVGQKAVVTGDIKPLSAGEVRLNGLTWVAVCRDHESSFPAGSVVVVRAVEGVKLVVEQAEKEDQNE